MKWEIAWMFVTPCWMISKDHRFVYSLWWYSPTCLFPQNAQVCLCSSWIFRSPIWPQSGTLGTWLYRSPVWPQSATFAWLYRSSYRITEWDSSIGAWLYRPRYRVTEWDIWCLTLPVTLQNQRVGRWVLWLYRSSYRITEWDIQWSESTGHLRNQRVWW